MFKRIINKIRRIVSRENGLLSETAKCRERLKKYCKGNGIDLGSGGDPIALDCISVDLLKPYRDAGNIKPHLKGDARDLFWFNDGVLDYVYSSHLLEDFPETENVLREWLRVLKPGGYLVLYCPDESEYRRHCKQTGQSYNQNHKIKSFSLSYVLEVLKKIGVFEVVHSNAHCEIYSFELVIRK